jgi:hypothetical protein
MSMVTAPCARDAPKRCRAFPEGPRSRSHYNPNGTVDAGGDSTTLPHPHASSSWSAGAASARRSTSGERTHQSAVSPDGHLFRDGGLNVRDHPPEVASGDVRRHDDASLDVLAQDHVGAHLPADVRDHSNRHGLAGGGMNGQIRNALEVATRLRIQLDDQIERHAAIPAPAPAPASAANRSTLATKKPSRHSTAIPLRSPLSRPHCADSPRENSRPCPRAGPGNCKRSWKTSSRPFATRNPTEEVRFGLDVSPRSSLTRQPRRPRRSQGFSLRDIVAFVAECLSCRRGTRHHALTATS